MKDILPPGIRDWPGLRARMLTFALDYDGTLVPICQRPEEARPDSDLLSLLQRLALGDMVIILTGRNPQDMERWIRNNRITIVASHGAEWRRNGLWKPLSSPSRGEARLAVLRKELEKRFENTPGVIIENKGTSVAFHYRLVSHHCRSDLLSHFEDLVSQWKEDNEAYEVLEGKYVKEVRPQGLNKGKALHRVLQMLGFSNVPVLAMGDDRTDEDMFRSLSRQDLSILVGDGKTSATIRLKDVWEARGVLEEILRIRQKTEVRSQKSE